MPRAATTTTPARPRAAHLGPERRRPQVLDAALAIAVRDGVGAVTIVSVAEELGVTRPVVYACFTDRVELVEALLDRERARLLESVLAALRTPSGGDDPEEAFVVGFQALLHAAAADPDPWRLLLHGDPDPAVAQRFRDARAIVAEQAGAWIRPALERWWQTEDLDLKMPVLIEVFVSTCEAAVRSLLRSGEGWTPETLGAFVGGAAYRAFRGA